MQSVADTVFSKQGLDMLWPELSIVSVLVYQASTT